MEMTISRQALLVEFREIVTLVMAGSLLFITSNREGVIH
tara:strand:+ start:27355 stop:27471 length:117 start_codon:yes stop_codon:yes gene_type:complete